MRNIFTIWKKELKDTVRDRRTLLSMIILPMVLMPAMIIGIGKFTVWQMERAQEQTVEIAIENRNAAPDLVRMIEEQSGFDITQAKEPRKAVKEGQLDALMVIPAEFSETLSAQKQPEIALITNSSETKSQLAKNRLQSALQKYNDRVVAERFAKADIDNSVLTGAVFTEQDQASQKEMGGMMLGFIIPLFIVIWSIVGGQYTAIDVSAGEKERKTLEPLLLTPVRRLDIVLGKFLAVATAAAVSVMVSLASFAVAFVYFGQSIFSSAAAAGAGLAVSFSVEPMAMTVMLTVGLLLVFLFSAALLSIAIFARSFKEAQSYIGPAYLVVLLPIALINGIQGFEAPTWLFAAPAVNAVLLFKEVLKGDYVASHLFVTYISLAVFAGLALWLATRIYRKEKVLFK